MLPAPYASVIIPTCRRPALALACVKSILGNDFADFEILVVDQDPTKRLKTELEQQFPNEARLVYLSHECVALDHARNMGIDRARGAIMIFVDDDVEVEPDWLRAYVEAFTTVKPMPGIVAGRITPRWVEPRPNWLPEEKETLLGLYDHAGELRPLPEGDLPIGANFAVLRQAVDEGSRFDERLDYSYARWASMLSGGDSFFSRKIKERYALYYQPRARVWHKIAGAKLTMRYHLRRNFWDGYTLVSVLHLSGSARPGHALGIVRWHIRAIGAQVWRLFFPRADNARASLRQTKTWMRMLLNCTHSVGVIAAALKLRWVGALP